MRNILAVRNDRFGELILNIPALRALKQSYPDTKLTLAVNSSVKDLAKCFEYVDEVVVCDDYFKKNLRKQKFDTCVVLNPAKETHWISFWAGIPNRVGYDRKWGILLTHKMPDNKNLGLKHEVDYNLDLVGLIGAKTNNKSISLNKLPGHINFEFAGAVAIHPFTSDSLKQWPVERFQQLAQRLTEEANTKVIIVGRDEGINKGGDEFNNLGNNVTNLINKTSLVELAQIFKQCRLLISGDSGPMHLAAAVGTPVIALFRNDLPGKTARRWGPWGQGHIVIEKSKLIDISVEEVVRMAKEKLQGKLSD